ncbi:hypothetical protein [Streptomyces acidiscabies]|uniref:hypothetical protein n=1 Tax=Streptomyces acidiscabies TaxID=42234 RepID=UPI0038F5ED5C
MGAGGQEAVWGECLRLGRCLLPLEDLDRWRRERRWEGLQGKEIGVEWGEFVFGVLAGMVFHAVLRDTVAKGAPYSVATLDAVPLRTVSDAVNDRPDWMFLAGVPTAFTDEAEEKAVLTIRLCAYSNRRPAIQLFYLAQHVPRVLHTITTRTPAPDPTCADLRRWADAGLSG